MLVLQLRDRRAVVGRVACVGIDERAGRTHRRREREIDRLEIRRIWRREDRAGVFVPIEIGHCRGTDHRFAAQIVDRTQELAIDLTDGIQQLQIVAAFVVRVRQREVEIGDRVALFIVGLRVTRAGTERGAVVRRAAVTAVDDARDVVRRDGYRIKER